MSGWPGMMEGLRSLVAPVMEGVRSVMGEPFHERLFLEVVGACVAGHLALFTHIKALSPRMPTAKAFALAYEVLVAPVFLYMAWKGWRAYQAFEFPISKDEQLGPLGLLDLLWSHPAMDRLCNFCQAFYVYDLFVAFAKEPAMIPHHVMMVGASRVAKMPYANYTAYFFAGIVELSNVPLRMVNIFRMMPSLREYKALALIEMLNMVVFALLFFFLRIFLWGYLSFTLTMSAEAHIRRGVIAKDLAVASRVGSVLLAGFTVMQAYW
mmetsp:Transcript_19647/g.59505  ORF Transcript_19647/g.59505 Transcript_19647/m.59505 type:complete len:266 (+) Transcript_19647:116-913(+)